MLSKKILVLFFCSIQSFSYAQKKYQKTYFKNTEILKEEGWITQKVKVGYWKFYSLNGELKEEGHYKNNLKSDYWYFYKENAIKEKEGHYKKGKQNNWWIFYTKKGLPSLKCQFKNGLKNGYCLIYKNKKLTQVAKFKNDKKIKEWSDFSSFKKDNNLNELQ